MQTKSENDATFKTDTFIDDCYDIVIFLISVFFPAFSRVLGKYTNKMPPTYIVIRIISSR